MTTHEPHPYACIFELAEGPPLWALADHIKEFGQQEPIVLLDNKILDGRRRELGCLRAGVAPRYRNFGSRASDGDDPLEFVMAHNYHRRSQTDIQRAFSAGKYATHKAGRPKPPRNAEIISGAAESQESVPTNAEAATKFEVSEAKVERAKQVLTHGSPELVAAVQSGEKSLTAGASEALASRPGRKKRGKPSANGTESFNLKTFSAYLGRALAELNKLAKAHQLTDRKGRPCCPEHKDLDGRLHECERLAYAWYESLAKKE